MIEFTFNQAQSALEGLLSPEFDLQILRAQLARQISEHNRQPEGFQISLSDLSVASRDRSDNHLLGEPSLLQRPFVSQLRQSEIQPETSPLLKKAIPPQSVRGTDQLAACNEVALALWRAGSYAEAQKLYATLLQTRPDLAISLLSSNFATGALDYFESDDSDSTRSAFSTAVIFQPSLWKNYFSLSQGYFLAGRYLEAVQHFTRLLELQPGGNPPELYAPEDTTLLYKLRSFCYLAHKKYLAAAQDASAALTLTASDALAYELRGQVGMLIGQWSRAKTDFESAVWLGATTTNDNALFCRGLSQLHLGSLASAKEDFGRAFQLNSRLHAVAGFMEQWCGYCLDHKGFIRRQATGSITGETSTGRIRAALTTSSRSVMAEHLERIAASFGNAPGYWNLLARAVLEFLRNDFNQALLDLAELETSYNASEQAGMLGWSYCYWLGLISLACRRKVQGEEWLAKALTLGLPAVLLLDGMPLS
jgi:tetratricopeptide (TPR) repeat protein